MTFRTISAGLLHGGTIRCEHCFDLEASVIEISHAHEHDSTEQLVLCSECSRLAGLLCCEGCNPEGLVKVIAGGVEGKLKPLFAPADLQDGRCIQHAIVN